MFKTSSSQVFSASIVPASSGAHAMTGTQENSTVFFTECLQSTTCSPGSPCSVPKSRMTSSPSSPTTTRTASTTSTLSKSRRATPSLSGSTKWLLVATLALIAFPSGNMHTINSAVSMVEALPTPDSGHVSHCPDQYQCEFACKLLYRETGTCQGIYNNVCVCEGWQEGHSESDKFA
ncbi:MAG: hypothetical protein J3R72DRAFT_451739 [Linnemannia gamsii]|nr:MAG: hypothetical protein J3R72DRAFT_451739 [Linnemannia gamsii]